MLFDPFFYTSPRFLLICVTLLLMALLMSIWLNFYQRDMLRQSRALANSAPDNKLRKRQDRQRNTANRIFNAILALKGSPAYDAGSRLAVSQYVDVGDNGLERRIWISFAKTATSPNEFICRIDVGQWDFNSITMSLVDGDCSPANQFNYNADEDGIQRVIKSATCLIGEVNAEHHVAA